jgi:hypothetical protein
VHAQLSNTRNLHEELPEHGRTESSAKLFTFDSTHISVVQLLCSVILYAGGFPAFEPKKSSSWHVQRVPGMP